MIIFSYGYKFGLYHKFLLIGITGDRASPRARVPIPQKNHRQSLSEDFLNDSKIVPAWTPKNTVNREGRQPEIIISLFFGS